MTLFGKRVRRPMLLAILLIGVTGCGLADYQSRMDAQRERVKEFDDANRALDDPIEIPMLPVEKPKEPLKDGINDPGKDEANPAWLFDFYLRLPKGFGKTPKDKIPYFSPFPCFRYSGNEPGYDILIVANLVAENAKEQKFGMSTRENFRLWVRMAVKDFYAKTNVAKLELKLPDKERHQAIDVKTLSPNSDVTTRILYQVSVYSDPGNPKVKEPTQFRVYIHDEPANAKDGTPGKQIAIVVHRPRHSGDGKDAFDTAIDACLGTLDANEALSKRQQYKKVMKR
jgi:hypothetical protein